jgi:hypothetical protein
MTGQIINVAEYRKAKEAEEVRKVVNDSFAAHRHVMTGQIINLAEYRKAKEAEEVRKVVNDYFAEHSQTLAWWLSDG